MACIDIGITNSYIALIRTKMTKMKNIGLFLGAFLLLLVSCQQIIDPEVEKKAIVEVINAETNAYTNLDFEKVISFYVQDSLNFRLTTGADNHVFLEGWNDVEAFFEEDMKESVSSFPSSTRVHVEKNDYKIKVYEKTAYVICTETWTYTTDSSELEISSRQVRFMEKVEDEWKIAFLSFIGTSGYEDEEDLEELGLEFNSIR